MATAVVYDGAGSGGHLFEGKKFWVAQRVPTRSRWLELITANGGHIVPLEKFSDIMIADHARKDAVPGSYSWKWIADSVMSGKLEDLEAYRAGPVVGTSRPVGSSQPTRNTRTPFTAADDRALGLWVMSAEKQGLSTKGNNIYQQLERINPRHTFQSWRDRWVKYGQFQSRPKRRSTPTGSSPAPRQSLTSHVEPLSNGPTARPVAPRSLNTLSKSRSRSTSATPPIRPAEGNPFTEEDGEILLRIYEDILNIDETRLIEAWEKFAEGYPQHTAQEWYKFWMDEIKPLRTSERSILTRNEFKVPALQNERGGSSQLVGGKIRDIAVQPVLGEQNQTYHESSRRLPTEKERFEHTYTAFAEGQGVEIELQPTVDGKEIQLFDLWAIIMRPGFNGFVDGEAMTNWDQVALKLGFDKSREPNAPKELRSLYEWVLADFADIRSQYRAFLKDLLNSGVELTDEQALDFDFLTPAGYEEEDQVVRQLGREESNGEVDAPEIPSSPPLRIWPSAAKRKTLDKVVQGKESTSRQPEVTPYKRQRVHKGKEKLLEIPSTPEDLLIFDGQLRERSVVRGQNLVEEQEDEYESSEEDEESMFVKPVKRKIFPKTTTKATKTVQFEPETQDFHFSTVFDKESGSQSSRQVSEDLVAVGDSLTAVLGSPHEDSSTQSQTDSQREAAEIREFVDRYVSLGYPEEIVQEAMLATTLETGDVTVVMEALMRGHGIPGNIEGVWTIEDDRTVRLNGGGEEYARVVLKHTEARCVKRRQLLSQTEVLQDS